MPRHLTGTPRGRIRQASLLASAAIAFAACGADRAGTAVPTCPDLDVATDDPVGIDLRWAGPWDHSGAVTLIDSWDDDVPGVEVEVLDPADPGENVVALVDGTAPTVTRVPSDAVESLRDAGLIRPLPDCGAPPAAGLDPGGRSTRTGPDGPAQATSARWRCSTTDTPSSGRDSTARPRRGTSWSEQRTSCDRAGIATPIAQLWPSIAGRLPHPTASERAPAALRTIARLWQDGLVLPPPRPDDLPPLGDGRAAIEFVREGAVWGHGSALAAGQAPDADLRLAPVPGARAPVVPVVATVWVVSAQATEAQAVAAAALVDWLALDEQQAALHPLTDQLPSSPSAAASPVLQRHWDEIPLFRDLWALAMRHGSIGGDEAMAPGALLVLDALTVGPAPVTEPEEAWQRMRDAIGAIRRPATDHLALLGCTYPDHEAPAPLSSCVG